MMRKLTLMCIDLLNPVIFPAISHGVVPETFTLSAGDKLTPLFTDKGLEKLITSYNLARPGLTQPMSVPSMLNCLNLGTEV